MALHNEIGKRGEELAVNLLVSKGLQILETNWHMGHLEVDVIAANKNEIIFVEVKTRSSATWGRPEEAIDQRKMMRCVHAAHSYMRSRNIDYPVRFDVFAIIIPNSGKAKVDYFKDAFYAPLG